MIFPEIFRFREKGPFADDIVFRVETLIDRLKSKVGHSDIITVGIDETYRNLPGPWLSDRPPFFFKSGFGLLNEFPGCHRVKGDE